jgi:exodeoxyribonuclease V beta subunit
MSEALRLLYVAVTRAKHRCALVWGRASGFTSSALGYAIHGDSLSTKMTEEQLLDEVGQLAQSSGGVIGCRPPRPQASRMTRRGSGAVLQAKRAIRTYDRSPRVGSFTSITGHDGEAPAARVPALREKHEDHLFANLPGGTRTGLLLHSILEEVDFSALDGEATRRIVEQQLRAHALSASLTPEVQRDLVLVGATPFSARDDAPTLARLDRQRQLRELQFTMGAGHSRVEELAALLRKHGARSYADRLAELHVKSLQSFLRGYVDLVFEWDGRWYVADYKSNMLPRYDAAELRETVEREHYSLQALLYSAAIQRYLRQRIPDFDAASRWGGAMFLFLRGMKGPGALGEGVLVDRLSPELLESLDAWLGGIDESR